MANINSKWDSGKAIAGMLGVTPDVINDAVRNGSLPPRNNDGLVNIAAAKAYVRKIDGVKANLKKKVPTENQPPVMLMEFDLVILMMPA